MAVVGQKEELVQVGFKIKEELYEVLQTMSWMHGKSIAAYAERLVAEHLAKVSKTEAYARYYKNRVELLEQSN